jgi:hypothetical protein
MRNPKIHMFLRGKDFRNSGQTDYEYNHSTECGYVRDDITYNTDKVTCKLCLRELKRIKE